MGKAIDIAYYLPKPGGIDLVLIFFDRDGDFSLATGEELGNNSQQPKLFNQFHDPLRESNSFTAG